MNFKLPGFLLNKKFIIPFIGIVVLVEIVWVTWVFFKPKAVEESFLNSSAAVSEIASKSTLTLTSSQSSIKVGEVFAVRVMVDSPYPTDGTDVIIKYDPNFLEVTDKNTPLKAGLLYEDYPSNTVLEDTGQIIASGITGKMGGIIPKGEFGSISFLAKTLGKTKIELDFIKGSTKDSNIIKANTAEDVLDRVENLEIVIKP